MSPDFKYIKNWEQLAEYFIRHRDDEYAEWWGMLQYSMLPSSSPDYSFTLMKEAVENGWKFCALYPMLNEKPTENMIRIGGVMEGGLYIDAGNRKSKKKIVSWLTDHGFTK